VRTEGGRGEREREGVLEGGLTGGLHQGGGGGVTARALRAGDAGRGGGTGAAGPRVSQPMAGWATRQPKAERGGSRDRVARLAGPRAWLGRGGGELARPR
jgi:hypothetical protein